MDFKFQIGDFVKSKNGATLGVVQERLYYEYPAGVRVKYYVYGDVVHNGMRFGGRKLHELFEFELEATTQPEDWDVFLWPIPKKPSGPLEKP